MLRRTGNSKLVLMIGLVTGTILVACGKIEIPKKTQSASTVQGLKDAESSLVLDGVVFYVDQAQAVGVDCEYLNTNAMLADSRTQADLANFIAKGELHLQTLSKSSPEHSVLSDKIKNVQDLLAGRSVRCATPAIRSS